MLKLRIQKNFCRVLAVGLALPFWSVPVRAEIVAAPNFPLPKGVRSEQAHSKLLELYRGDVLKDSKAGPSKTASKKSDVSR
jgi:hypothetical protein